MYENFETSFWLCVGARLCLFVIVLFILLNSARPFDGGRCERAAVQTIAHICMKLL